jgi:hypothetical protein
MTPLARGLSEYTASKWEQSVHWQSEPLRVIALTQHAEEGLLALVLTDQRVLIYYVDTRTGLPTMVTFAVFLMTSIGELAQRERTLKINGRPLTFTDEESASTVASIISELTGLAVGRSLASPLPLMTDALPAVALAPVPEAPSPSPSPSPSARPAALRSSRKKLAAALVVVGLAAAAVAGYVAQRPDSPAQTSAVSESAPTTVAAQPTTTRSIPSSPAEVTPSLSASNAVAAEYLSQLPGVDIFVNGSDKLTLGNFLCDSLRDGDSTRSIVIRMQDVDYQADEIGAYLGAATSTLCPAYYSQVAADLRSFASGN